MGGPLMEVHPGATQPWQPPQPPPSSQQQQQPQPLPAEPQQQQQQQQEEAPQQQQQERSMINLPALQRVVPAGGVIELLVPSAGGVTGVVYTLPASGSQQVWFTNDCLSSDVLAK